MGWAVEVNEVAIYIGGAAAEWWAVWRLMCLEPAGRITTIESSAMGSRVLVECVSKAHAEWVRDLILRRGAMKKAAVIRRQVTALAEGGETQ